MEGRNNGVVNKSKPELIGRALVPFFFGEDDALNEQLAIPDDQELFRNETTVEVREFKDGYYQPVVKREGTGHVLENSAAVATVAKPTKAPQAAAVVVDKTGIMKNVQWKQKRRMRKLMTPDDMMRQAETHAPDQHAEASQVSSSAAQTCQPVQLKPVPQPKPAVPQPRQLRPVPQPKPPVPQPAQLKKMPPVPTPSVASSPVAPRAAAPRVQSGGQSIDVMQLFNAARSQQTDPSDLSNPDVRQLFNATRLQQSDLPPAHMVQITSQKSKRNQTLPREKVTQPKLKQTVANGKNERARSGSHDSKKAINTATTHFAMPASMTAPAASSLPLPSFGDFGVGNTQGGSKPSSKSKSAAKRGSA